MHIFVENIGKIYQGKVATKAYRWIGKVPSQVLQTIYSEFEGHVPFVVGCSDEFHERFHIFRGGHRFDEMVSLCAYPNPFG